MKRYLTIVIGEDSIKKRVRRGFIGGLICILLSAFGGGLNQAGFFVSLTMFAFFGVVCGILSAQSISVLIGSVLIAMGFSIVFGLTVERMSIDKGIYFIVVGLAFFQKPIRSHLNSRKTRN